MTFGRDEAIYHRHAAGLYRQTLLTHDEMGMAEQVVNDVILDGCLRPELREDYEAAADLRLGYRTAGVAKIWLATRHGGAGIPCGLSKLMAAGAPA